MENVLIVSSTEKGQDFLAGFLRTNNYSKITIAGNGSEARRLLNENDYGLVIINAPLTDETGEELSITATETSMAGVILIVRTEIADEVSSKVENYGVFVLAKPLSRLLFYQTLKLIAASRSRLLGLKHENVKLQEKIEEIRLVDRAKCVLIQHLNITEQQAHRYIEKQAMDRRITRRKIAEEILNIYEN